MYLNNLRVTIVSPENENKNDLLNIDENELDCPTL